MNIFHIKVPCRMCNERHYNCHSNCEKYKEFHRKNKELHEEYAKDRKKRIDFTGLKADVRRQEKKRRGLNKWR